MAARLLLDENLSERLLQPLTETFPGSDHVRSLSGSGVSDSSAWEIARSAGWVLVTRDEDFVGMSVLRGAPPKIVWLNIGNSRNAVIAALLKSHAADIVHFVAHEDYTFLAIGFYKAASSH